MLPAGAALGGLTAAEVRHEVLVQALRSYLPVPDLRVIERPGWLQLVMPSFRSGGLNGVARCVLPDDLPDDAIEATLDAAGAIYDALGVKYRWNLDPDTRPLDLPARLARRGLRRTDGFAMACATAAATAPLPDDVTVERVTAATLPLHDHVVGAGWGLDPAPLTAYHRALLADPRDVHHLFLARYRGEPAAVAGHVLFPRSTYLVGGVVLPAFRGRGLYRALVTTRLRTAAAAGRPLATTHAVAATSAPILTALGFTTVCAICSFSNR